MIEQNLIYTDFQALVVSKSLLWQYSEDTNWYYIYTIDETIQYSTTVLKSTSILVPIGIDMVQEALNVADFETNYKSIANKKITPISMPSASSIFVEKAISPLIASTWRALATYTIPSDKQMIVLLFSSLSAAAGTKSRFAVKENLASFNTSTNTFTKLYNSQTNRFFSNIDVLITTSIAGNVTLTITYTNQDGTTGRTATAILSTTHSVNKRSIPLVLQGDDYGVLEVTNITDNASVIGEVTIQGFEILIENTEDVINKKNPLFFNSSKIDGMGIAGDRTIVLEIFHSSVTAIKRSISLTYTLI